MLGSCRPALLLLLTCFALPLSAAEIAWVTSPTEALAEARRTGRPILAYVASSHCGYCRKMERKSWSHATIQQLVAERYVALRLSADIHPEEVQALRVRAYPTTLVLTPEGEAVGVAPGYVKPKELAAMLTPPTTAALATPPIH